MINIEKYLTDEQLEIISKLSEFDTFCSSVTTDHDSERLSSIKTLDVLNWWKEITERSGLDDINNKISLMKYKIEENQKTIDYRRMLLKESEEDDKTFKEILSLLIKLNDAGFNAAIEKAYMARKTEIEKIEWVPCHEIFKWFDAYCRVYIVIVPGFYEKGNPKNRTTEYRDGNNEYKIKWEDSETVYDYLKSISATDLIVEDVLLTKRMVKEFNVVLTVRY